MRASDIQVDSIDAQLFRYSSRNNGATRMQARRKAVAESINQLRFPDTGLNSPDVTCFRRQAKFDENVHYGTRSSLSTCRIAPPSSLPMHTLSCTPRA